MNKWANKISSRFCVLVILDGKAKSKYCSFWLLSMGSKPQWCYIWERHGMTHVLDNGGTPAIKNIRKYCSTNKFVVSLGEWQRSATQLFLFGKHKMRNTECDGCTAEVSLTNVSRNFTIHANVWSDLSGDGPDVKINKEQTSSELFYTGCLKSGSPCWDIWPAHGTESRLRTCRACTSPCPHRSTRLLQS